MPPTTRQGLAVPAALLLQRALGELAKGTGLPWVQRCVRGIRILGTPVVGEALVVTGTVLFVSQRGTERHVTVGVRVHRRGGKVVLAFEVGVALDDRRAAPGRGWREGDQRRAA